MNTRDDESAIHEAGTGYHAPGPSGYGSRSIPCLCDECDCPFQIARTYPPVCDSCQYGNHLGVRLDPLGHKENDDG